MSFSHLSRTVRDVTGKTFARKFITLGKVITYWAEAVGPELALKTYPIGMKVRKAQGVKEGKNIEAVLEISASSADATLIHYQKALILERLRLLLGAGMVVDIRVTHNTPAAPIGMGTPTYTRPKPPKRITLDLSDIDDPELREALESLGGNIGG